MVVATTLERLRFDVTRGNYNFRIHRDITYDFKVLPQRKVKIAISLFKLIFELLQLESKKLSPICRR